MSVPTNEHMRLDYNGSLHKFYRWTYEDSCPRDLCTYFWKLVLATVSFPVTWWSYPFKQQDYVERLVIGGIAWLCMVTLGYVIGTALSGDYFALKMLGGAVGILIGLTVFALFVALVTRNPTLGEIKQVISERRRGFKEKYCPRIDWTFTDTNT